MILLRRRMAVSLLWLAVVCSTFHTSRGDIEYKEGSSHHAGSDYMKREHSLVKPFTGTGMDMLWDFGGSTVVTNEYVRLTSDRQSQQGLLFNNVPVNLRHWEVRVSFQVHGEGDDLFGDGFAFWYTKSRMEFGPVFGSRNHFNGLGVFFDTYSNAYDQHEHQHPYISAAIGNGTYAYNHDEDGTHGAISGCAGVPFRESDYTSHASIIYYMDTLSLYTRHGDEPEWVKCFEIEGVQLPTGYYFGFSAATGDLTDNHDIFSLKTFELYGQDPDAHGFADRSTVMPFAAKTEKPSDAGMTQGHSSSGSTSLYVIVFIIILFVAAIMGFLYHQKSQRQARTTLF